MTNIKAIFIDRDGTIGGDTTIHYQDLFIISIHKNILAKLKAKNIKIFSFTNQPGIADGIATVADFVQELEGFGFDDIYVCPHKHGDGCECRKPSTGIFA